MSLRLYILRSSLVTLLLSAATFMVSLAEKEKSAKIYLLILGGGFCGIATIGLVTSVCFMSERSDSPVAVSSDHAELAPAVPSLA